MYVKKLSLQNYRCFESLELEFKPGINCLIGTNGSGKTAVLDAISGCIQKLLFNEEVLPIMDPDDCRRFKTGEFGEIEIVYPKPNILRVLLTPNEQTNKKLIEFKYSEKPISIVSIPTEAQQSDKDTDFSLSFDSSSIFLVQNDSLNNDYIRQRTEILSGFMRTGRSRFYTERILACYVKSRSSGMAATVFDFSYLAHEGMKKSWRDILRTGMECKLNWDGLEAWYCMHAIRKIFGRGDSLFDQITSILVNNVSGLKGIEYDPDTNSLKAHLEIGSQKSWVSLSSLSSGYQRLIGLFGEIAMRCAILNPELGDEATKKTPGFVLIDELDLHLHPRWQREIVNGLRTAFPNLQFIFTTHAPLVIQSCDRSELISLSSDIPEDLPGTSPEDILEYVQGIEKPQQSVRRQKMMAAAREFYDLVNRRPPATDAEKAAARHRLDELMEPFSDDPVGTALLETERKAAGL
ncbi:MAG: AAA family ATPase [Alphaproteobacteria bacterium]|nr:AAA family ATPase [Alphaproteobacteria bacterium]